MSDHPLTTNVSNFDVYFSAKVDETIVVSKFIRHRYNRHFIRHLGTILER